MTHLDPLIHQRTRLRIMGALARNRRLSFTALRDRLGLTDGNLASHARKLEAAGYVTSRRTLRNLSFEVVYVITPEGSEAMRQYIAALRDVVEGLEASAPPPAQPRRRQA